MHLPWNQTNSLEDGAHKDLYDHSSFSPVQMAIPSLGQGKGYQGHNSAAPANHFAAISHSDTFGILFPGNI